MTTHGHRLDGSPITDDQVQAWADEAERGYAPEQLQPRPGGRPRMGSEAASVESVRLDPELKGALAARAEVDHVSVSELIRTAVRQYLHTS